MACQRRLQGLSHLINPVALGEDARQEVRSLLDFMVQKISLTDRADEKRQGELLICQQTVADLMDPADDLEEEQRLGIAWLLAMLTEELAKSIETFHDAWREMADAVTVPTATET